MERKAFIAGVGSAVALLPSAPWRSPDFLSFFKERPLYAELFENLTKFYQHFDETQTNLVYPPGESPATVGYHKPVLRSERLWDWYSPETDEHYYDYSIRLAAVPSKLIPPGGFITEGRWFVYSEYVPALNKARVVGTNPLTEGTPWLFVFVKYRVTAVSPELLIKTIRKGQFTISPDGSPPVEIIRDNFALSTVNVKGSLHG